MVCAFKGGKAWRRRACVALVGPSDMVGIDRCGGGLWVVLVGWDMGSGTTCT